MPTIDDVIKAYIKIRDQRGELKQKYEAEDAVLKDKLERLESWLKSKQLEQGVTQFKSDSGVAFQVVKNRYSCVDWSAFHNWLIENNRLDLLERRVAQRALNEMREETGKIPPGLNVFSEIEINVRRG